MSLDVAANPYLSDTSQSDTTVPAGLPLPVAGCRSQNAHVDAGKIQTQAIAPDDQDPEITVLLKSWGIGNRAALEQALPRIYRELRRLAARSLRRERMDHTLQATALVNEVYLKLAKQDRMVWQSRSQFFGVAAQLMRRVLVDHARKKQAAKRDGGIRLVLEDDSAELGVGSATRQVHLIGLDKALCRLQAIDARQAKIVELRYFAGLKVEEIAEGMELSPRTVKREWQMARAWLRRELGT